MGKALNLSSTLMSYYYFTSVCSVGLPWSCAAGFGVGDRGPRGCTAFSWQLLGHQLPCKAQTRTGSILHFLSTLTLGLPPSESRGGDGPSAGRKPHGRHQEGVLGVWRVKQQMETLPFK